MSDQFITADQITIIGEQVPVGKYKARLLDAEGSLAKSSGKPIVWATWEIQGGDHDMKEARSMYPLGVSIKKNKKGIMQTYAGGIADFNATLAIIGASSMGPKQWPVEPTVEFAQQVAVILKKAFGNKIIDLAIMPNNYERENDDGTKETVNGTRVKVIKGAGPIPVATGASAPVSAPAAAKNPFQDIQ